MRRPRQLAALVAAALLAACTPRPGTPMEQPSPNETALLVGPVTRDEVLRTQPRWADAVRSLQPDPAAEALGRVAPGATVTVYLGTWCGDSVREVGQLWRDLEALGEPPPFALEYVALDRRKRALAPLPVEITHVPTFVVARDGVEVGRVVETSPHGISAALAALLTGAQRGVISASLEPR